MGSMGIFPSKFRSFEKLLLSLFFNQLVGLLWPVDNAPPSGRSRTFPWSMREIGSHHLTSVPDSSTLKQQEEGEGGCPGTEVLV